MLHITAHEDIRRQELQCRKTKLDSAPLDKRIVVLRFVVGEARRRRCGAGPCEAPACVLWAVTVEARIRATEQKPNSGQSTRSGTCNRPPGLRTTAGRWGGRLPRLWGGVGRNLGACHGKTWNGLRSNGRHWRAEASPDPGPTYVSGRQRSNDDIGSRRDPQQRRLGSGEGEIVLGMSAGEDAAKGQRARQQQSRGVPGLALSAPTPTHPPASRRPPPLLSRSPGLGLVAGRAVITRLPQALRGATWSGTRVAQWHDSPGFPPSHLEANDTTCLSPAGQDDALPRSAQNGQPVGPSEGTPADDEGGREREGERLRDARLRVPAAGARLCVSHAPDDSPPRP